MPGIKGMSAGKPRAGNLRLKIWQSMRVMRRFTVPDLCRTSGANLDNVQKFVRNLLASWLYRKDRHLCQRPGRILPELPYRHRYGAAVRDPLPLLQAILGKPLHGRDR